tara:strand:+ start:7367 stop:7864 length:498 start_codon:yes stop_codon:yes gene_type:complete
MTPGAGNAVAAAAMATATEAAGIERFELLDHDGTPHEYIVQRHGLDDGLRIISALVVVGGQPLGTLLQGGIGKMIAEGGTLGEHLDKDIGQLLSGVDFADVGRDLSLAVARSDMPGLMKLLLQHTHRGGLPMRDPIARDAAYQGNYAEMFRIVWRVIQANNFLPF